MPIADVQFALLLDEADLALYPAKRSGKNTFRFDDVGMTSAKTDLGVVLPTRLRCDTPDIVGGGSGVTHRRRCLAG